MILILDNISDAIKTVSKEVISIIPSLVSIYFDDDKLVPYDIEANINEGMLMIKVN